MAIWHLSPVNLDDPSWQASSHRGAAVIRAENENEAREIAQEAFGVKTGFRPQRHIIAPPWKSTELVHAVHVSDPRFEEEGPAELLSPSFKEIASSARA